jgi:hypothetical protein
VGGTASDAAAEPWRSGVAARAIIGAPARSGGTAFHQKESRMRIALVLAGIVLAAVGLAAFTGQFHFTQDKEVVKIGGLSASVKQERSVPQWIGGVAVLVGLGLIGAGAMRR